MTETAYVHTREPDPEWVRDLATIAPPSDRVTWLKLLWEPGETWEPVQRWEIREMVPRLDHVDPDILDALKGPDPRLEGHFVDEVDPCPLCIEPGHLCDQCHGEGKIRSGRQVWESPAIISRRQWELYRATGCYALRFWILQGSHGGHKWTFSPVEQSYLKARHLPYDTPPPGFLPYAPYDRRVRAKLLELDRLRQWQHRMDWDQRAERKTAAGLWVRRDRKKDEVKYAAAMVRWLESEIKDLIDDLPRSAIPDYSDYAPATEAPEDEAELTEALITDTSTEV